MGQTPDQIASQIDRTRENLRANLQELEARAKDAADWRSHFRKNPERMTLAAFVGGALLAMLVGKR